MGGSGKQSLTRLAAYVSGLEVFQVQLRKGYSIGDLKVKTKTRIITKLLELSLFKCSIFTLYISKIIYIPIALR